LCKILILMNTAKSVSPTVGMSAHPSICTVDYRKGLTTAQKSMMEKQVSREVGMEINRLFFILQDTVCNNKKCDGSNFAKNIYTKLTQMIKDKCDTDATFKYLNESYYFAKMPVEYLKLYGDNTSYFNMAVLKYCIMNSSGTTDKLQHSPSHHSSLQHSPSHHSSLQHSPSHHSQSHHSPLYNSPYHNKLYKDDTEEEDNENKENEENATSIDELASDMIEEDVEEDIEEDFMDDEEHMMDNETCRTTSDDSIDDFIELLLSKKKL
jgi:hypothetical protein